MWANTNQMGWKLVCIFDLTGLAINVLPKSSVEGLTQYNKSYNYHSSEALQKMQMDQ